MHWARRARGLLVIIAVVLTGTATASAATNLIKNGTFEGSGSGSLSGWGGSGGTLSLVTGDGGGHAAQLTASSGATQTFAYIGTKPVKSAVAGTTYQLAADVESALAGQSVCLVLKELKGTTTTVAASAQSCVTPTTAWQAFPPVTLTVQTSGDSVTAVVLEKPAVTGAVFAFDNVVLQTVTSGGDTTPPTVPMGVAAKANGPTSVTVSWNASTDNTGVAGYDVYRDGTKITTVGGSTTTYTDLTVQPSTPYSYTVDAFDAVPNTSAQSSPPATVTTPSEGGTGSGPAEPIIVIMFENKTYENIMNSANDPYIKSLIAMGTLYTNYEAAPGSLPDYLANTAGVWTTTAAKSSDNLFHQLQTAGVSWGEYMESMPSTCYTGADTGEYKKGHNPAVYYSDITSNPAACANVVPYSAFDPAHLRAFSYVVPNLLDDMHDGANLQTEIADGDAWLSANVPAMLSAGAEVIVTWDEGVKSDEHVVAIAVGGTAAAGATDGRAYTQPGLLAGLEDVWGFPLLNDAQTATPVPIS